LFYFWRSNELGDLWLSGGGIRDAFTRLHPEGPVCSEVTLLPERDALKVSFILEAGLSPSEKTASEDSFRVFARGVGFADIQAGWTSQGGIQESLTLSRLARFPLVWGAAAWVLVAILRMGFSGTLLATASALAAFAIAALFTTERGDEIRRWLRQRFNRRT
jgi:hypothetical protein